MAREQKVEREYLQKVSEGSVLMKESVIITETKEVTLKELLVKKDALENQLAELNKTIAEFNKVIKG